MIHAFLVLPGLYLAAIITFLRQLFIIMFIGG